jgi:hypothetical protein
MAKRLTDNVITGTDRRLGISFYYSPHFGQNIMRKSSSLTGARVKKEAAFKGFRESGNRMKDASPIAATLYKLIPKEIKQYSLYRLLTGEALKMIKSGFDSKTTTDILRRTHIDPLLNEPEKQLIGKERSGLEKRSNRVDIPDFNKYPGPNRNGLRRIENRLRRRIFHQYSQSIIIQDDSQLSILQETEKSEVKKSVRTNQKKLIQALQLTKDKIPELIYLGRLPECKKLKMWVRSSGFPGTAV